MADTNKDLWLQLTAESETPDESTPVDLVAVKDLIEDHNENGSAHADIREMVQAVADRQTDEIKEYGSKREFPVSGDTSVIIYVDVSTGNLYRYNTQSRQYESLAMDTLPPSVVLDGVPTAPTARTGTNTQQIATTAFVQNELAALREQSESTTPVYYDGKTKTRLSLLGENGTIVTNVADGRVERGSSDAVTGGQLWNAQQDMANMSALAARNIAANSAEIELLKKKNPLAELTNEVKDEFTSFILVEGSNTVNAVTSIDEDHIKHIVLSVKTDGAVAENNTGLVSGGAVYEAIDSHFKAGDGISVQNGVISISENIATKEDLLNASDIIFVNGDHTAAMRGETDGKTTYAINVRANGSIQKNDGRIVTGGTVYEETRLDKDGHIVLENDTAAQNIVALDNALYAVQSQLDGIPEIASLTGDIAELKADRTALQETVQDIGSQYLDKDLKTLSEEGARVIRETIGDNNVRIINGDHTTATLGEENGVPTYAVNVRATGKVAENDGRIVTGQVVYKETRPTQDGSIIEKESAAGDNLFALDIAFTGLRNRIDELEETHYIPGNYISVSDNGEISVTVDGEVSQGNKGLVIGDQIADAIQNSESKTGLIIKDVHDEMLERIAQIHLPSMSYPSIEDFPTTGEDGKLYVDNENNSIYRWDPVERNYVELHGNKINDCIMSLTYEDGAFTVLKVNGSEDVINVSLTNEEIDTLFD